MSSKGHQKFQFTDPGDVKYAFIAEWYDPTATIIRKYFLSFYPKDNSVELFDLKNQCPFLRRTKCDRVTLRDMFIGNTVEIMARQMHLVNYADMFTSEQLGSQQEKTVCLIGESALDRLGEAIELIYRNNLTICKAKIIRPERGFIRKLAADEKNANELNSRLGGRRAVVMELMGNGAVERWKRMVGPSDPVEARIQGESSSLGALFRGPNPFYASPTAEAARHDATMFFPADGNGPLNTAVFGDVTCCVIKPHAVVDLLLGKILQDIQKKGFQVTAMKLFQIERVNAEEFYEVYKGVVSEYTHMVSQLTHGPCVALEISGPQNVAHMFREYVGPADPEIARLLRPSTLRAKYGENKVKNAIHCTDLPEDGILEVEYFFKILDQ